MTLPWIAMTGPAQAGKDTFAGFLANHGGYHRIAFADPLKAMALSIDPFIQVPANGGTITIYVRLTQLVRDAGWEKAKTYPDCRRFLQRVGKDGVRDHISEYAWIDLAERTADGPGDDSPIVFTDCRFQNELDMVKSRGGVRVHIEREFVQLNFETAAHASENSLPVPGPHDFIICNDGSLADLELAAEELVTALA